MVHQIDIDNFLKEYTEYTVIDVRSEKEYSEGHIPNAINIPILNDEERKIVGTTYKQNGRQPAVYKGLELTGPHLTERLRKGVKYSKNGKVLVHCWRGGMRSEFFSFLLHYYGLEPAMLIGGYKAYRKAVHNAYEQPMKITILSGKTGSAKTELLSLLKLQGEQVIDLEFLAKHRGSTFGALAFNEKCSQEQFENELFEVIQNLDTSKRIWIEDENRTIGDKVVPEAIWSQMIKAPRIVVQRTFEERLDQIQKDYGQFNIDDLTVSMQRIGKRLGPQHLKAALEYLREGNVREAFSIALKYYDKAYDYQLSSVKKELIELLEAEGLTKEEITTRLCKI